jgi:PelA/Pel-15E family pectate lyase
MQWSSQYDPGRSPHYLCTFDNGATTAEIAFLSMMWHATAREDCKAAVLKGLDYILAAQYPNGGWPQVYPLEGDYHDDITFNDDAMTNILEVLRDVAENAPQFACVDEARRARAAAALNAGLECVMAIQVRQKNAGDAPERLVGWSAQYDALTFAPSVARLKEPIALASVESSNLLKFLMSIENPSPEVVASIEAGLSWLDRVKATNVRRAEVDGRQTYIEDNNSTDVLWARFYDIETDKPLFPGSEDGVIYNSYEAMARNNHSSGYDFYSSRPNSAVKTEQRKWRKRMAEQGIQHPNQ